MFFFWIYLDITMDSELNDSSLRRKTDSDSIVRGILSNSIKYNNEKQSGLNLDLFFFLFFLFKVIHHQH